MFNKASRSLLLIKQHTHTHKHMNGSAKETCTTKKERMNAQRASVSGGRKKKKRRPTKIIYTATDGSNTQLSNRNPHKGNLMY